MLKASVVILLSTFNGELFIDEQIESIINQSYINWKLIVRDDGSTDRTVEILKKFSRLDSRIEVIQSSGNVGPLKSFTKLLEYSDGFDYVMFCDQDDVWLENKIQSSLLAIEQMTDEKFKLVYTNYYVSDGIEKSLVYQQDMTPRNTPNNILVQSWLMGCTMIIDQKLIKFARDIPVEAVNHDNWFAKVASVIGKIGYLNQPTMVHRLHANNVTQTQNSKHLLKQSSNLLEKFFNRNLEFSLFEKTAIAVLDIAVKARTQKQNLEIVKAYKKLFNSSFMNKRKLIKKYEFRAFTMKQNVLFKMILFFGKSV